MTLATAPVPTPSAADLEAVDRIEEMAFWQLMLADDLLLAECLVERLVAKMRARMREIKLDAIAASVEL